VSFHESFRDFFSIYDCRDDRTRYKVPFLILRENSGGLPVWVSVTVIGELRYQGNSSGKVANYRGTG